MIGEIISHYKILEKLGEGGMGVVFKAQDTQLNRTVALKFLPDRVNNDATAKARFLQEAQAAAGLNHPNICTIHGVEEHDGALFMVMEYVEGGTLREKVPFAKVDDAITIATQIGDALQEAHAKGIVHRDIKADNIMLSSKGQAKVMDFGLAKLKGAMKLTRTSSTVGTLGYMAPEQIQGGEVDPRSDIFAFGVLLFEMLTGKLPFRGEHEAAMVYSIVNEDPEPIQKYLPDISGEIVHILGKALEKNPDDRYQSVQEMVVDLRRSKKDTTRVSRTQVFSPQSQQWNAPPHSRGTMQSLLSVPVMIGIAAVVVVAVIVFFFRGQIFGDGANASDQKKLVVLPFENLGPADKEYFVDGMTDEITSRLSGLSKLSVIARSGASLYKKSSKTFKQIGDELGVNYILQGTVRWETYNGETHVRVNPTLIRVEDGTQVWSQSMESVLSSAFKLQSDIAGKVASALDIALATTEKKSLESSLTENSEAYDYYLQAIGYIDRKVAVNDLRIAQRLLEKAIQLDPSFAAAYAKLSYIYSNKYWFFFDRTEQCVEKSRMNAQKAIDLSPELSESHEAMGWYYYHGKLDYTNALKEFSLALQFRPSNSTVHFGIAAVQRRQGDMLKSIESFKKSIEGNPRAADLIRQLGETQTLQRQYANADDSYRKALELTPDVSAIYQERIMNLLLWKGDVAGARHILEQCRSIALDEGSEYYTGMIDFNIDILDGKYAEAESAVLSEKTDEILNNQFQYAPTVLVRAHLERWKGNDAAARQLYDSARIVLEQKVKKTPEDERLWSALGLAYAGLGRKDDAVKAGERGVSLLPVEKEAWRGTYRLIEMAQIYTIIGDQDKAIDILQQLLSIPSEVSVTLLRLQPWWKPLHTNKHFQQLVAQ